MIGHDRLQFDEHGVLTGEIPPECVKDCSRQGSCDSSVEYWVGRLRLDEAVASVRPLAVEYLRAYGAWNDLSTADDETLARRILWTACCDVNETGDPWTGLQH